MAQFNMFYPQRLTALRIKHYTLWPKYNYKGGNMKKLVLILVLAVSACTHFQVAQVDPKTGYFPTDTKADIIKNEKYDLDSMKSLILISSGSFVEGQVRNLNYFDKIINLDDLQTIIVQGGLQDKVSSTQDKIGINKAYTYYKPFLWLRYYIRSEGRRQYGQFILTDPKDMKDIFIAEKHLDYVWAGVSDQNTWYPLCNAFIDYMKENSKSFRKP
jgi:hypothetical protein